MRTARVLTGAALVIAALGPPVAPAFAGDFEKLEIEPGNAQPGAMVTVSTAACGKSGVGNGDASAVGGPASFDLKPGSHQESVVGQFRVPEGTKNGTYGIGVRCKKNGKEATGDLVVTTGTPAPSAPAGAGMPSKPMNPANPANPPKGGMKTGVGGTSDDSGTSEIVAGVAVLATAAIGGTWFLRRRSGGGRV